MMQRTKEVEVTQRPSEELLDQIAEIEDHIARRAFELFEGRNGLPGNDTEDWFRARSEVLHPALLNLSESDRGYVIQAEMPGFPGRGVQIGVEPRRVVISGKRDEPFEQASGRMILAESCAGRILRAVELPSGVDASRVRATLQDGILLVDLPKAENQEEPRPTAFATAEK
jgi:HSP20 family molecular chaperone IbpA